MSPDERRQAILDAVVPIILETGEAPSTKQVAQAAGIAEGTIFRVFADKPTLMRAVAEEVLNPSRGRAEFEQQLAARDSLRDKVRLASETLLTQTHRGITVMIALRPYLMAHHREDADAKGTDKAPKPPAFMMEANKQLLALLERMFSEHSAELRVDPATAATALRSLVLGARHPGMHAAPDLTSEQIADIIIGGVTLGGRP